MISLLVVYHLTYWCIPVYTPIYLEYYNPGVLVYWILYL